MIYSCHVLLKWVAQHIYSTPRRNKSSSATYKKQLRFFFESQLFIFVLLSSNKVWRLCRTVQRIVSWYNPLMSTASRSHQAPPYGEVTGNNRLTRLSPPEWWCYVQRGKNNFLKKLCATLDNASQHCVKDSCWRV